MAQGAFREDLFYRLNVVAVELPPLRQRKSDIPLLVDHFLARYAEENGKAVGEVSKEALDLLTRYAYPAMCASCKISSSVRWSWLAVRW